MFVGDKQFVLEMRQKLINEIIKFIKITDLNCSIEVADDPFFIGDIDKKLFQQSFQLKYEVLALIPFLKEQQWKTDFGVMKLQVNSMTTRTQAPARVTLAKNAIASIKSPLQGELKEVLVKQLQMVQAGQPLLILKPDIDFINYWYELHSKLETLDLEIKYQSAQEKRVKKLLKQQSASQQELQKTE